MGKNKRNIFGRSSKVRLSDSSNKTAESEKSNENVEPASNDLKTNPMNKGYRKNINIENEISAEMPPSSTAVINDFKNTKVDRKKTKEKAKQISYNNSSLKRRKKKNVVKQMLKGFQHPKEVPNLSSEDKENQALSSLTAKTKDQLRLSNQNFQRTKRDEYRREETSPHGNINVVSHNGNANIDNKPANEDIYESRKLLIRQMQGMIAKHQHKSDRQNKGKANARQKSSEVVSEYDSWSDLEENFAKGFVLILHNIVLF